MLMCNMYVMNILTLEEKSVPRNNNNHPNIFSIHVTLREVEVWAPANVPSTYDRLCVRSPFGTWRRCIRTCGSNGDGDRDREGTGELSVIGSRELLCCSLQYKPGPRFPLEAASEPGTHSHKLVCRDADEEEQEKRSRGCWGERLLWFRFCRGIRIEKRDLCGGVSRQSDLERKELAVSDSLATCRTGEMLRVASRRLLPAQAEISGSIWEGRMLAASRDFHSTPASGSCCLLWPSLNCQQIHDEFCGFEISVCGRLHDQFLSVQGCFVRLFVNLRSNALHTLKLSNLIRTWSLFLLFFLSTTPLYGVWAPTLSPLRLLL